ncbi:uncharacterized protein LOC106177688 [Lingula anatina]|uniref:Uncharacterized protein LOC106177688 n=1 Tax=Lingula anatina TaxID=7574 RepID=A0A1S3K030_LINAN|nr:uncharacterized protein LOC106177688 [Lingula anatina]|eukprot:XP_013415988.1 uncharacterized protein LOC106177688 [Lingula anatina]
MADQQIPHKANAQRKTGLGGGAKGGKKRKGSRNRLPSLSDNDSSASSSSTATIVACSKQSERQPKPRARSGMRVELERLLQKYSKNIIRNANNEQLCKALLEKGVIDEKDVKEVEYSPEATCMEKNEVLLTLLTQKNDQAFNALCEALRQSGLADTGQQMEEESASIPMVWSPPENTTVSSSMRVGDSMIPPLAAERTSTLITGSTPSKEKCVTNVIKITNSSVNVVIGDQNQQNIVHPAKQSSRKFISIDEKAKTKEQKAVEFLNGLFNPFNYNITYSKPYEKIVDAVRQKGGFKQFGVGPLQRFLDKSPCFDLRKNSKGKVEQVVSLPISDTKNEDLKEESCFDDAALCSDSDLSELESFVTCPSDVTSRDNTPLHFLSSSKGFPQRIDSEIMLVGSENWQKIQRKKRDNKTLGTQFPTLKQSTENDQVYETEMSNKIFESLCLNSSASEHLEFKPSDEVYFCRDKGKASFMEDIVSFWNTPGREGNAYIIIGIEKCSHPPHKLIGIGDGRIDADYQNLFLDEFFTSRPKFRYIQHEYDKMLFGIVIISPSQGMEKPCVAEQWHREASWNIGEIWVRRGTSNQILPVKHHDSVYKWFQKPTPYSEVVKGRGKPHSLRNNALQKFLDKVDMFKDYQQFLLIVGQCKHETRHLQALTSIPWFKVVDFDTMSRENGTFSVCEPLLKTARYLEISTWQDQPGNLGPRSVNWFFPRGYHNCHEMLDDPRSWIKRAGPMVDEHCIQIAEYCNSSRVLTAVILWYGADQSLEYLRRFMAKLDENVDSLKVAFCIPSLPDDPAELKLMCRDLDIDPIFISLERICCEIESNFGSQISEQAEAFQLPHEDVEECGHLLTITPQDAAWLDAELDVLYLSKDKKIYLKGGDSKDGEQFLRGGQISWHELNIGCYDARRDVLPYLLKTIRSFVEKGKSALISLNHEPGSGGTTLGMRALWDLHCDETCACVYVSSPLLNASSVFSRIEWLYLHTHLPVVVLIDGKDITQIHKIFDLCLQERVIVLCVQRYNQPIDLNCKRNRSDQIWLSGKVAVDEAPRFDAAFSTFCKGTDKRSKLQELVYEVKEREVHYVWEFGITVYAEEYVGIQRYVKGYLQIPSTGDLKPWQYVLGFLALAYFYGHVPVPAQFFAKLLNVSECEQVTLNSLHSHSASQFIIEEKNYCWRINHVIVAKEILEQLLSRKQDSQGSRNERLSLNACQNLHELALKLIEEAGKQKMKNKSASPVVSNIINNTFIQRNYKELSQDDNRVKRKMKLSQLLYDIPREEKKELVLKKLTEAFPKDPSYWAHLGRYHGMKNPESKEAIKCLDRALELRQKEIKQKKELGKKQDPVLCQVYHMHGIILKKRITARIGGGMIDEHTRGTFNPGEENFEAVLKEVVGLAKQAAEYFKKCREHHAEGMEESYGYIGEISTLLHVVDFLQTHGKPAGYFGYMKLPNVDPYLKEFLEPCFPDCDRLLRECEERTTHDLEMTQSGSDQANLSHLINWFNALFKDANEVLKTWQGEDSIQNRRTKVAFLMMKHHFLSSQSTRHLATLEQIHCKADVLHLINLLKQNFKEVKDRCLEINITNDVKKWLKAIRHHLLPERDDSISEVMEIVRMWYQISPNAPDAVYYMYVLTTLCAIGTTGCPGSKSDFVEASQLHIKLKKVGTFANRFWRIREWLGKGEGIRRLVNHVQLGEWNKEGRFWKDSSKHELLQVCRGTILSSVELFRGTIALDTSHLKGSDPIKVFFVPKFSGMYGKRFKHQHVEFYLGFSMTHGCEAYNVKALQEVPCGYCKLPTEVSSLRPRVSHCKKCNNPVRLPAAEKSCRSAKN